MFIKILTPNHNGKVELTVSDLEALIQEAVDKAIVEDRANRPIQFWYGNGDINKIDPTPNWDWTKVICKNDNATLLSSSSNIKNNNKVVGGSTLTNAINDMIGE
jgi:hypothetical protein